jgi:pyrroline-5-carboxylate reductase
MGVNAQTSVPAFTAGQVLTAAEMTEVNTGIPVFADTTARDAAFGGAGEKVLAEGQYAYIEATNTTQFYDGSSWLPVGTTPGMVYITGASFSAQTTVSMAAGVFTSTYKTYLVIFQTVASTFININMRVNASGSPVTTGNYAQAVSLVNTAGSVTGIGTGSGTALSLVATDSSSPFPGYAAITVYDPANASSNTGATFTSYGSIAAGAGTSGLSNGGLRFNSNAAHDGLTFIAASGNMTGFYRVYGISES